MKAPAGYRRGFFLAPFLLHAPAQLLVDGVHEFLGGEERMVGADEDRQVLGHPAGFHHIHANLFERLRELVLALDECLNSNGKNCARLWDLSIDPGKI